MPTAAEYEALIRALGWSDLQALWEAICRGDAPGWEPGKAFEYLVLRMFELDGVEVRWPYSVLLFNQEVEQIDGAVYCLGFDCLVESKDTAKEMTIVPVAKLRNQLLRRPAGTLGLLFSRAGFTEPAIMLAHFSLPQAILLWKGEEVEYALQGRSICSLLLKKYRGCVELGIPHLPVI